MLLGQMNLKSESHFHHPFVNSILIMKNINYVKVTKNWHFVCINILNNKSTQYLFLEMDKQYLGQISCQKVVVT